MRVAKPTVPRTSARAIMAVAVAALTVVLGSGSDARAWWGPPPTLWKRQPFDFAPLPASGVDLAQRLSNWLPEEAAFISRDARRFAVLERDAAMDDAQGAWITVRSAATADVIARLAIVSVAEFRALREVEGESEVDDAGAAKAAAQREKTRALVQQRLERIGAKLGADTWHALTPLLPEDRTGDADHVQASPLFRIRLALSGLHVVVTWHDRVVIDRTFDSWRARPSRPPSWNPDERDEWCQPDAYVASAWLDAVSAQLLVAIGYQASHRCGSRDPVWHSLQLR